MKQYSSTQVCDMAMDWCMWVAACVCMLSSMSPHGQYSEYHISDMFHETHTRQDMCLAWVNVRGHPANVLMST